jgi:hypothetical protein
MSAGAYGPDGTLASMTASTGSYGATTDWLGSVTGLVNSSGSQVESITYRTYKTPAAPGSPGSSIGYAGSYSLLAFDGSRLISAAGTSSHHHLGLQVVIVSAVVCVYVICHWRNVGNITRWMYIMKFGEPNKGFPFLEKMWGGRISFDDYRRGILIVLPVAVLALLVGIYLLLSA